MKKIPLEEFAGFHGQARAAKMIGITQARISQLINSNEDTFVFLDGQGAVCDAYRIHYAVKRLGRFK